MFIFWLSTFLEKRVFIIIIIIKLTDVTYPIRLNRKNMRIRIKCYKNTGLHILYGKIHLESFTSFVPVLQRLIPLLVQPYTYLCSLHHKLHADFSA